MLPTKLVNNPFNKFFQNKNFFFDSLRDNLTNAIEMKYNIIQPYLLTDILHLLDII